MTSSRCRPGNPANAIMQTAAGNQFPEADFTAHGRFRRMCPAGTQEDDSPDMALRGPCLYPHTAQPHSHKTAHRRTPRALFTSLMVRGKICFYIMTTPARRIKPAWRIQGKSFRIFIQPEKQIRTILTICGLLTASAKCRRFHDENTGLYLSVDNYIIDELVRGIMGNGYRCVCSTYSKKKMHTTQKIESVHRQILKQIH